MTGSAWLATVLALSMAIAEDTVRLSGVVRDDSGAVVPGVTATLVLPGADEPLVQVADGGGGFVFEHLSPGEYTLVLSLPGFREVRQRGVLRPGEVSVQQFVLPLAGISENVQVVAEGPAVDTRAPAGEAHIQEQVLSSVPLAKDRIEDALPLLPSVVRGPDGLLNMSGTRADQSALLMNGVNGTDPVTGQFAIRVPLEAIATIDVQAGIPSSQFGNATGGVANVVTRPGQDKLDVQVQNFIPRLRIKDGVKGIDAFTPRMRIAGPIQRGRLWIAESVNYRFARARVPELETGGLTRAEQQFESFDSMTQIDFAAHPTTRLVGTFLAYPGRIDNVELDTLHPYEATPDLTQRGWNAALAARSVPGSRSVVDASLSVKQFDVAVRPKSAGVSELVPTGTRGNYFNLFDRDSRRYDGSATVTASAGRHLVRAGGSIARTSYDGIDSSLPIVVVRADGSVARRIEFAGDPRVGATNLETGSFVQDQWAPHDRVAVNAGIRYAYEGISGDHTLAPQVELSLRPFDGPGTVVKAGYGRLFDKLPLNAADFGQHQERVVTTYSAAGVRTVTLANVVAEEGLRAPVADTWNVELDHQLSARWTVRLRYQDRHGRHELVVNPADDALLLESSGRSRSRSFEVTGRRRLPRNAELNVSYVRSVARGHLNNFVSLFGTTRNPVILEDQFARQPFDAPNRVLAWGVVRLPFDLTVAPTVEYRTGFPYTTVDEEQAVIGTRYGAGRYPDVFTVDMQVTREIPLSRSHRARVGLQFFNLTNHFNPRDVQNNAASPLFGQFANSVGRQVRLKFVLLL